MGSFLENFIAVHFNSWRAMWLVCIGETRGAEGGSFPLSNSSMASGRAGRTILGVSASHPPLGQDHDLSELVARLGSVMAADYVGEWLETPNNAFAEATPLQVIRRGEGDLISRMIHDIEGGGLL
jgi:hypothetical protein